MSAAAKALFGAAEPPARCLIGNRMSNLMQRWVEAMRQGRYEQAWALSCEALLARDPATRDDRSAPCHTRWVWDGRPFAGLDVLVRCYHGLGDTIQFARYLPELSRHAASVTLEAQPRLIPLLRQLPGVARLIPFDPAKPAPPSECDLEITELPFALRLAPSEVRPPYLAAQSTPLPPRTIGICYAAGEWVASRSVPAELFGNICSEHSCLTLVAEPTPLPVLNPEGCPFDVAATASLLASVDLVITVDTMIAHLSGAMGRPTWLLLKSEPDWRWTPGARATPWYPSMRIFPQPAAGAWEAALEAIWHALAASDLAAAKGAPAYGQLAESDSPRLVG